MALEKEQTDLQTMAEVALSEARRELEGTGRVRPYFLLRNPRTQEMERLPLPGEAMDDGERKQILFGLMRTAVRLNRITATILVTDGWVTKIKADEGLREHSEAIIVSVETPRKAFGIVQFYERDRERRRIRFGERITTAKPPQGRVQIFPEEET